MMTFIVPNSTMIKACCMASTNLSKLKKFLCPVGDVNRITINSGGPSTNSNVD